MVAIVGVRLSTDVSGAALKSHPRPVPAALRIPHASTSSSLRRSLALAPFVLAPFSWRDSLSGTNCTCCAVAQCARGSGARMAVAVASGPRFGLCTCGSLIAR